MPPSDKEHAHAHKQQQHKLLPRNIPRHRRGKPELSIKTLGADDDHSPYSRSPEYDDVDLQHLRHQPTSAASPVIPLKSAQRRLKTSAKSPATPSSSTYPSTRDLRTGPVVSRLDSHTSQRLVSAPAIAPPQSPPSIALSDQSFRAGPTPLRERDARTRQPRLSIDRDAEDRDGSESPTDATLGTSLYEPGPQFNMPDKENRPPSPDYDHHEPFPHFDSHSREPFHSPSPSRDHLRDPHDLSLSPRNVTRDSLLGNMLLSLDQFSMGQADCAPTPTGSDARAMSGFAQPSFYYEDPSSARGDADSRTMTSATSRAVRAGSGSRAHGYSYSSDYEPPDELHRVAHSVPRSRRSNSSSTAGFHSSSGRVDSMRERPNQRGAYRTQAQRRSHIRIERGSTSSSTSSIDASGYASILGSQRQAHGVGDPKRSSSLEVARRQDSFGTQPPEQYPQHGFPPPQRQPSHKDFANSLFTSVRSLDDYVDDAAPNPTVPVGPRRQFPTMPSMPIFGRPAPMDEPLSPERPGNQNQKPLERKRSSKSARSIATRQSHHSSRFASHDRKPAPPTPPMPELFSGTNSHLADSAPAPHVDHDNEPVHPAGPNPAVSLLPKEKQNFFRRMFGGSSKNGPEQSAVATTPIEAPTETSPAAAGTMFGSTTTAATTPRQPSANASPVQPIKSPNGGPSRQTSSHGSQKKQDLQKKPSGFFRRRKKSISVSNEPLPLPPALPPMTMAPAELSPAPKRLEVLMPRPAPSPVTSLRKAMDPYLNTSQSSTPTADPSPTDGHTLSEYHSAVEEINQPDDGNPRSFSPDYEPDPRATIRPVQSVQKFQMANSPGPEIRRPETPTRDVLKPRPDCERTGSFLHDESDSEGSPQWIRTKNTLAADDIRSSLAPIRTQLGFSSPSPHNTIVKDKKLDRLTQDSTSTTATDRPDSLQLPIEGVKTEVHLKTQVSAASIPSLTIEGSDFHPSTHEPAHPLDEPNMFVIGEPTEDDRARAQKIFDGSEDFVPKEKAASWMGEEGPVRQRTLRAYMDLHNFHNRSIVTSLRDVCNRLVLRAETQQVDRILVTFSQRWVDCNPNHGFKSTDVIHTICYSVMLLNTDLHMADIESKMTRSQFIKNTMGTVRQAAVESAPDAFDRPSILPGKGFDDGRRSLEHDRSSFRNSFIRLPARAGSAMGDALTELDDCGPLVKAPFDGSLKAWESQMEVVLKDVYASIRDERLPLFGAEQVTEQAHSAGGLSVMGMLKRSPSVLSKAASENPSTRGRGPDSMLAGNSRWASKSRSRPRGFGGAGLSSSRTSFDDGQSIWSPVESVATWSRASLGRTHTSMSMDSFGSRIPRGEYHQSIGFANALSQAIIREDPLSSVLSLGSDDMKPVQLLEDESLELAGPPWVKEGILMHKHHLDGVDKKARDRNWSEVFCVIQKGNVSIFCFSPNKSTGKRSRTAAKKGGVVGGGNWQENATTLGTWSLRLCLASALPPPGYSKLRPHVWALSLPTGAVHLFHVNTPEICNEFVTTANYWAARLSTHPLVGGVSNVEYGWSDAIINNALITAINENSTTNLAGTVGPTARQRSGSLVGRSSLHSRNSSFRSVSSFDFGPSNTRTNSGLGGSSKLPGDIVTVADWTAPTQSMRPSRAAEKAQLDILLTYVKSVEEELRQHNSLRSPMLLAFTPRGSNAQRAMANWERRSAYLLREIVKFRTYVDVLLYAKARKEEVYQERDIAQRAARGSLVGVDALSFEAEEDAGMRNEERGRGVSRGEHEEGDLTLMT